MEQSNVFAYAAPKAVPRRRFRTLPPLGRAESRAARLGMAVVAFVLAAAFFWFVVQYWSPAHPGVDQSGYLMGGKQLAATGSTGLKPHHPLGFISNMYVRNDATGYSYPKYPVGLPLLYAIALWTCGDLGPKAAHLVSPVGMAMAVLGLYFLARRFASTFASLAGMIILATSPVVLLLADNPNSHASCMAFCVWGAFFLVRFWETGSIWRGLLGGLFLGFAVTIRYPEGVFGAMVGLVVLTTPRWPFPLRDRRPQNERYLDVAGERRSWFSQWRLPLGVAIFALLLVYKILDLTGRGLPVRVAIASLFAAAIVALLSVLLYRVRHLWRPLTPAVGWLIPVAALLCFNRLAMGTWTGYDTTNESTPGKAFTVDNFFDNWELFTRKLHDTGLFFALPLGVLGMALALRTSLRRGLLLWLWLIPGAAVYLSYYWAPDNGLSYLRFLITLLPPLAVGAAVTLDTAMASATTRLSRIVTPVAVGLVVLVASAMGVYRGLLRLDVDDRQPISMESQFRQELNLSALSDVVLQTVPKGSLLIAPSAPLHALQFLGDYECFDAETFHGAYAARLAGEAERNDTNPDDPNPVQPQRRNYILRQIKGKNDNQLAQVQTDIARAALARGQRVFILSPKAESSAYLGRYRKPALQLDAKVVNTFVDLPRSRPPEDTPPANDNNARNGPDRRGPNGGRPGGPGNGPPGGRPNRMFRAGARPNNPNWLDSLPVQAWQVIEVKPSVPKPKPAVAIKPPEPAKPPAAAKPAPSTKPTTARPAATKPAASRPTATPIASTRPTTGPAASPSTRPMVFMPSSSPSSRPSSPGPTTR